MVRPIQAPARPVVEGVSCRLVCVHIPVNASVTQEQHAGQIWPSLLYLEPRCPQLDHLVHVSCADVRLLTTTDTYVPKITNPELWPSQLRVVHFEDAATTAITTQSTKVRTTETWVHTTFEPDNLVTWDRNQFLQGDLASWRKCHPGSLDTHRFRAVCEEIHQSEMGRKIPKTCCVKKLSKMWLTSGVRYSKECHKLVVCHD